MKTLDTCFKWIETHTNGFIVFLFGLVYALIIYMIYKAIFENN